MEKQSWLKDSKPKLPSSHEQIKEKHAQSKERKAEELLNYKMVLLPSIVINVSWSNSIIQIPKSLTENVSKQSKTVLCGTIGNMSQILLSAMSTWCPVIFHKHNFE